MHPAKKDKDQVAAAALTISRRPTSALFPNEQRKNVVEDTFMLVTLDLPIFSGSRSHIYEWEPQCTSEVFFCIIKFLNCVDCVQPRCLPCPLLPTPDLLVVFPWYDLRSNSTFPCKRGGGKEPNSSLSIVPSFRQPQGTKILRIEAQTSKKVLFLKAINVTRKKAALTTNRCPYIFKAQHLAKFSSRLFFLPPKEKEENELPPHFFVGDRVSSSSSTAHSYSIFLSYTVYPQHIRQETPSLPRFGRPIAAAAFASVQYSPRPWNMCWATGWTQQPKKLSFLSLLFRQPLAGIEGGRFVESRGGWQ